ncbi:interleukin-17 receptor A [Parambassis ranga]|uniref:Interleukin-17 receptor A n=1 Tax=Parambassis ranga TaxID=210632 RepID=A0A6P7KG02_9TELE|nr:interleukin-17 receptor A-like [Parambassis ranga]
MTRLPFFWFYLTAAVTASSSLRILDDRLNCSQPGLDQCKINRPMVKPRQQAPTGPERDSVQVGVRVDKHGHAPVLYVRWKINADASYKVLNGSNINIMDESTNQSVCVQFSYSIIRWQYPDNEQRTLSLDGVTVQPEHTYTVSVWNLPEPDLGHYRVSQKYTVPDCFDETIQKAQMCVEKGSLWDPQMSATVTDKKAVVVEFKAAQYSERYQVSIHSGGFHYTKNISKENRTTLNVTFEFNSCLRWEMLFVIQPFFIRCENDCRRFNKTFNHNKDNFSDCQSQTLFVLAAVALIVLGGFLAYLRWKTFHKGPQDTSSSAAKGQLEVFQVQERRRVLIIYSLDHPLYKNVVLKLCAFLMTKCGTEVVLDLLDSTRLGVLGGIQWLDWHKEQIESSSDKILILCSRGVQAKWRAMCSDKKVFLREDSCSSVGDMLTLSLSLIVPHFICSGSYKKYIVAYFDDICSEEDIPAPFKITVRYKLMKQFEEVFFRILDTEQHEPGRVKQIDGLSGDKYHQCPSGRALHDAIEAFCAYQRKHPRWFEDELLEIAELEVEETSTDFTSKTISVNSVTYSDSTQLISQVTAEDVTEDVNNIIQMESAIRC